MAKRMQDQKGEEVWQNRNLNSSSAKSLIASKSLGILIATGTPEKQDEKKFKIRRIVEFSSATARCIPWRVNGHSHGETCLYKEESGNVENQVAYKTATEKPNASRKSDCQGGPKAEKIQWSHNLHVSPATNHHTEAVFSMVREIYGREHDDLWMIWT